MKLWLLLFATFINCSSLSAFKKPYEGPGTFKDFAKSMDAFCTQLAKKYQLTFLMLGNKKLVHTQTYSWSASFASNDSMTLDAGRETVVSLTSELWKEFNSNRYYLAEAIYTYERGWRKTPTPTSDMLGIKIAFWDANVDRPLHPYLACILVANNKIQYFYADPATQALQEPIVETLDEAFIKVTKNPLPSYATDTQ